MTILTIQLVVQNTPLHQAQTMPQALQEQLLAPPVGYLQSSPIVAKTMYHMKRLRITECSMEPVHI